jgi:hypothetical protein
MGSVTIRDLDLVFVSLAARQNSRARQVFLPENVA